MSKEISEIIEAHESKGKYVTIDGMRIFFLDEGEGDVVFCIHGIPTSSYLYRKVTPTLSEKRIRAIAIDLPGLGFSARPANFDYCFKSFTSICKELLDHLKVERFHLLIHDIGTAVGLYLASQIPQRIKSITQLNGMLDMEHYKKPLPLQSLDIPVIGEIEVATITHLTWMMVMQYAGVNDIDGIPTEELKAYVDVLKREDNGKAFLKIVRNFDRSTEFTQQCIRAFQNNSYPVQLIWGIDDPFLTFDAYATAFIKARPDVITHTVKAKHLLQEDAYEFIADKVQEITKRF